MAHDSKKKKKKKNLALTKIKAVLSESDSSMPMGSGGKDSKDSYESGRMKSMKIKRKSSGY